MTETDRKTWMNTIPDTRTLAHLSLPGTHDSAARKGASQQICLLDAFIAAQFKEDTIGKQLEDGIRFLDIRCCAVDDAFTIYHGPFSLHINFAEILDQCVSFLEENPSETVLVKIQQEHSSISDEAFIKIFDEVYADYLPYMYREDAIPQLKDVRGKIVIVSRVKGLPGIPWDSLSIQDDYTDTDVKSKLSKVENYIVKSITTNSINDEQILFLNHVSATNAPFVTPKSFADAILPRLIRNLENGLARDIVKDKDVPAYMGIISMDFYNGSIIDQILQTNYVTK